jgi:hypothetical protein
MECRSCQTLQPYTNHTCISCGKDPWNDPNRVDEDYAPLPRLPLPPGTTAAAAASSSSSHHVDSPELFQMTQAGIEEAHAIFALNKCNNDPDMAFAYVIDHNMEEQMTLESSRTRPVVDKGMYTYTCYLLSLSRSLLRIPKVKSIIPFSLSFFFKPLLLHNPNLYLRYILII